MGKKNPRGEVNKTKGGKEERYQVGFEPIDPGKREGKYLQYRLQEAAGRRFRSEGPDGGGALEHCRMVKGAFRHW